MMEKDVVTTKEFVFQLVEHYDRISTDGAKYSFHATEEIGDIGRQMGWLEEIDILYKDRWIERRNAARIVHEFLRIVMKEPDEMDWKPVHDLRDLYDCKACAKHVAQVCLKGIMEPKDSNRFQLLMGISRDEMNEIFSRMFDVTKRKR